MGIYILYVILSPGIKLITGTGIKIDYKDYEKYLRKNRNKCTNRSPDSRRHLQNRARKTNEKRPRS